MSTASAQDRAIAQACALLQALKTSLDQETQDLGQLKIAVVHSNTAHKQQALNECRQALENLQNHTLSRQHKAEISHAQQQLTQSLSVNFQKLHGLKEASESLARALTRSAQCQQGQIPTYTAKGSDHPLPAAALAWNLCL